MSNKIDKLFNRKLADHSLAPSASAWQKVEAGLSKKNNYGIAWRAAAVFVLIGLLTGSWFYWQSEQRERAMNLAAKEEAGTEITPEVKEAQEVTAQHTEPVQQVASNNKEEKKQTSQQEKKKISQQPQLAIANEPQPIEVNEGEPIKTETNEVTVAGKTEKPIVIEFTLDPIAQVTPAIAQTTEPEKPALKKIWNKALDIKNGEAELGGLREAKNELFALDFRKDKSKRN